MSNEVDTFNWDAIEKSTPSVYSKSKKAVVLQSQQSQMGEVRPCTSVVMIDGKRYQRTTGSFFFKLIEDEQ